MHESVLNFLREYVKPEEIRNKYVLEVGSLNINGSAREVIEPMGPQEYFGIDMRPGDGVDAIQDICDVRFSRPWDVIICTEMLEHAKYWREAIRGLKANLSDEYGLLVITTRSPGFPRHEYPGDYWRYTQLDMQMIFADFEIEVLMDDPEAAGVFFKGHKGVILDDIELTPAP